MKVHMTEVLFYGIFSILIFSKILIQCVLYVFKCCVENNQNQQQQKITPVSKVMWTF